MGCWINLLKWLNDLEFYWIVYKIVEFIYKKLRFEFFIQKFIEMNNGYNIFYWNKICRKLWLLKLNVVLYEQNIDFF